MSTEMPGWRTPDTAEEASALLERVHLVGIGGAGMSGIARIVLARGGAVSGSDARDSRTVLALRAQGALVAVGHQAENLDQFDGEPSAVVVSTAINSNNPEVVEARRRGVPVLARAEALAALMLGHRVACVAGTHGKTSTTSMLTVALQHGRFDPSFAIGGDLNESGANAHHGGGRIFVAEADESDGSFLVFSPSVAVVTNVEPDHLDYHGTAEAYTEMFGELLHRVEPGGVLVAGTDDTGAAELADQAEAAGIRVRRYGRSVSGPADARILEYRTDQDLGIVTVEIPEVSADPVEVRVAAPGEHMAANAVAALLAGIELGADVEALVAGLAAFGGVRRRFEFKGRTRGIRVFDDYAHHPTEVAAQLAAARALTSTGRLIAVFQPHLFSRTQAFAAEFASSLADADEAVVLDVYGAREDPVPGVSGKLIADQIPLPTGQVHYAPSLTEVPERVAELARPGDLVLTMGAGDVTMLGPEILAELDRDSAVDEVTDGAVVDTAEGETRG